MWPDVNHAKSYTNRTVNVGSSFKKLNNLRQLHRNGLLKTLLSHVTTTVRCLQVASVDVLPFSLVRTVGVSIGHLTSLSHEVFQILEYKETMLKY